MNIVRMDDTKFSNEVMKMREIEEKGKQGAIDYFLNFIEKQGNKLPHPVTLFVIFSALVVICSAFASYAQLAVDLPQLDPKTGAIVNVTVQAKSLLDAAGIRYIFEEAVTNFTGFAPVGIILVAMFGVATADGSGLIKTALRKFLLNVPPKFATAAVIFTGVMSNIASDAGYVVVIPLGALIFQQLGRNPMAGIAAGFFGVSGGFSANLLLGSIDPLLGGFSTVGARIFDPNYFVTPVANYYFMFVSTFLVTIVGTVVNAKWVEPRLGQYTAVKVEVIEALTAKERRGLLFAFLAFIVSVAILLLLVVPADGILRNPTNGDILTNSPFMNSIVIIVALLFFFPGLFYGIGAKTFKNDKEFVTMIGNVIGTLGGYLVLTFVAAQFVAYFKYSNLGIILAVYGAGALKTTGLVGIPLLVAFIFCSAVINLLIGSTVTKWSIMAPIFIPMFMLLHMPPEYTQLAYRIGDSATHIVSPLMPFFAIVLTLAERYDKTIGIGSLVSMMMPYSVVLLLCWTIFMVAWILIGLPIGPGVLPY